MTAERAPDTGGMGLLPPNLADRIPSGESSGMYLPSPPTSFSSWRHLSDVPPDTEVYGDTSGVSFHRLLLDTLVLDYLCITSSSFSSAADLAAAISEASRAADRGGGGGDVGVLWSPHATDVWMYSFVGLSAVRQSYL